MKKLLLSFLGVLLCAGASYAQMPITIRPDTGMPSQALSVTIVGNGTHFLATRKVSHYDNVSIEFTQAGVHRVEAAQSPDVWSDTIMTSTLYLSPSADTGWYTMTVTSSDTTNPYTYTAPHAFYVQSIPEKILSISPSSAYRGQSLSFTMTGQSTQWSSGQPLAVLFVDDATKSWFISNAVTPTSSTSLTTTVSVPDSAEAGAYDVAIVNISTNTVVDSALKMFQVQSGAKPAIVSVTPDTGVSSTSFDVTIVGENTGFQPTKTVSTLSVTDIDLWSSGQDLLLATHPTGISTSTTMIATLALPDSLTEQMADLQVKSTFYGFDYHYPFYIEPHSSTRFSRDSAALGQLFSVQVRSSKSHFISVINGIPTFPSIITLVQGQRTILGTNIMVTDDTTLSVDFAIPPDAAAGSYTMSIVEPGSGRTDIIPNSITVTAEADVRSVASDAALKLSVAPNPASGSATIYFTLDRPAPIQLTVLDALGRAVTTLANGPCPAGQQHIEWNTVGNPAGNYFYELTTGDGARHVGKITVQ